MTTEEPKNRLRYTQVRAGWLFVVGVVFCFLPFFVSWVWVVAAIAVAGAVQIAFFFLPFGPRVHLSSLAERPGASANTQPQRQPSASSASYDRDG